MIWLKSIGAVIAGFAIVVVLSTVMDMVMESSGIIAPANRTDLLTDGMLAIALTYRSIITVLGAFVTAKLAPRAPMTHALVLGAIGFLAATAGMLVMWKIGHQWYAIALVVTAIPLCWLGGRLGNTGERTVAV